MSAAKPEEKEQKPAPAAEPSGGSGGGGNKLTLILSVVNILCSLGMVGVLFLSFQKEKAKSSVEDIATSAEEHGKSEEGHGGGHGEAHGEAPKESHGGGEEHGGGHGEGHGGGHGEGHGAEKKKNFDFGKMINLDQFTVNLATPGSVNPKFVRVNISIEAPNEDIESEINAKMPQVRNAIIDLFNSKRPSDLATVDGREYLKEEIKNALNAFLSTGKVKGVFFTSFALAG